MKRLRHRLGRWLLRDEPKPAPVVTLDGEAIVRAIRIRNRRRGQSEGFIA